MSDTREADELVRAWQELQEAQVTGDASRLAEIGARALAESKRAGASREWELLAREAGRDAERVHEEVAAQPVAGVGDETVTIETESAPEPVAGGRRVNKKGSLIWLAFVLGWVLLQVVQSFGDGNGSP